MKVNELAMAVLKALAVAFAGCLVGWSIGKVIAKKTSHVHAHQTVGYHELKPLGDRMVFESKFDQDHQLIHISVNVDAGVFEKGMLSAFQVEIGFPAYLPEKSIAMVTGGFINQTANPETKLSESPTTFSVFPPFKRGDRLCLPVMFGNCVPDRNYILTINCILCFCPENKDKMPPELTDGLKETDVTGTVGNIPAR